MKIIEKYTGEKTYMFPNDTLADRAAVLGRFPAALTFSHIVETDENGEVMWAFQNLSAMRTMHKIDPALSESEAIAELQRIVNTEPEPPEENTPEERIAAALEMQNLLQMPTVNEDDPDED